MLLKMKMKSGQRVYMNVGSSKLDIEPSLLRSLVAQMSSVGEMDFIPPGYETRPITISLAKRYGEEVFVSKIQVAD